jgi:hypothetical protein
MSCTCTALQSIGGRELGVSGCALTEERCCGRAEGKDDALGGGHDTRELMSATRQAGTSVALREADHKKICGSARSLAPRRHAPATGRLCSRFGLCMRVVSRPEPSDRLRTSCEHAHWSAGRAAERQSGRADEAIKTVVPTCLCGTVVPDAAATRHAWRRGRRRVARRRTPAASEIAAAGRSGHVDVAACDHHSVACDHSVEAGETGFEEPATR